MRTLTILLGLVLCLPSVGADKKPLTKEKSARHAKVIEAAIRIAAKKPTGELTKEDLEKVTNLWLEYKKLTSVKGLEKLNQLKILTLSDNQLTDVKGLEKHTQLKYLVLDRNQLTDVKDLEKLTQLEELFLNRNQLTNVKGLEKLTKLTFLNIDFNKLTSVKGLEKLTQLKVLQLKGNPDLTKAQIDQLQKALPKCRIFHDYFTNAERIGYAIREQLAKLTGELTKADYEEVTSLELNNNQLTNVKGLEKLTQLKVLHLYNNKLTDVTGLEKLTQLKVLMLKANPDLTKAQIDELKKALPKCKIYSNPKK